MQNKDFFSGVPIEEREFLLRLLKYSIICVRKILRISILGMVSMNVFASFLPVCVRYPVVKRTLHRFSIEAYIS